MKNQQSVPLFISRILLATIIFLAFALRFFGQTTLPYGFHRDEASMGYNAYSILQTARDEWGSFLPLHFKAFGDYPPGVYFYLVALCIPCLGLSELAVRFPAIILGTFTVPFLYLFVKNISGNKNLALFSGFVLAITPWHILQSRASSEAIVGLFFTLLGMLTFFLWVKKIQKRYLIFTFISYLLALFSYNAMRLGLPLLHLLFVIYLFPEIKILTLNFKRLSYFTVPLIISIAVMSIWAIGGASISVANNSTLSTLDTSSLQVEYNRAEGLPTLLTRALHNKYQLFITQIVANYGQYFSFDFLFLGGGQPLRFMSPRVGNLLLICLPFLLLGLFLSQKIISKRLKYFLLAWLFFSPLVAALTNTDIPNVRRSIYLLIPLCIFTALGFYNLLELLQKEWQKVIFLGLSSALLIYNFVFAVKMTVIDSGHETVHSRSYGYKEVFSFTETLKFQYKSIVFFEAGDAPSIFYLFYTAFSPEKYQSFPMEGKGNLFQTQGTKVPLTLDQYTFVPGNCPPNLQNDVLYIGSAEQCLDLFAQNSQGIAQAQILEKIKTPDKLDVFYIYKKSN